MERWEIHASPARVGTPLPRSSREAGARRRLHPGKILA